MIHLLLLLLGAEAVKRHWLLISLFGFLWAAIGAVILMETVEGIHGYTMHGLGVLLVLEGAVTLTIRLAGHRSRFWLAKATALILPGIAIVETPLRNLALVSILFGIALVVDSMLRSCTILLVRFRGWRFALFGTAIEFVLALLAIAPWPVTYQATVPFCVSVALILSGWSTIRSGIILRRLAPGAPVTSLPIFEHERGWQTSLSLPIMEEEKAAGQTMVVHVWTPVASAVRPKRRMLVDRYVAAVDSNGAVTTGHAALEMAPDVYISHYSAADLDYSNAEFRQALHSGPANSVTGRFLPSYPAEVDSWCEATEHVEFQRFSSERLRAFWASYREDSTYNLTNRNCSVAVALALDAALEGVLAPQSVWSSYFRLLVNPELHFATVLRKRARSMTWTPGLVLDYARALQRVVEMHKAPWPMQILRVLSRWRLRRRLWN
jgi:uncharacterized membrane protein HdeD (DUF308 family)